MSNPTLLDPWHAIVSAVVATMAMYLGARAWPPVFSVAWQVAMQPILGVVGRLGHPKIADAAFAFFGQKDSLLYVPRVGDALVYKVRPWRPSVQGTASLIIGGACVAYIALRVDLRFLSGAAEMGGLMVGLIVLFAGLRAGLFARLDDKPVWWIGDTIIATTALRLATVPLI